MWTGFRIWGSTAHVTKRCRKAVVMMNSLYRLSFAAALSFFDIIFDCRVWDTRHLGTAISGDWIPSKPLHKKSTETTRTDSESLRLATAVSGPTLLFWVPSSFQRNWQQRLAKVYADYLCLGYNEWKRTHRLNRHVVTCFVVHGFHHAFFKENLVSTVLTYR